MIDYGLSMEYFVPVHVPVPVRVVKISCFSLIGGGILRPTWISPPHDTVYYCIQGKGMKLSNLNRYQIFFSLKLSRLSYLVSCY